MHESLIEFPGPLVFALGVFLAIPLSMAQIACEIDLGLSINTGLMSTIASDIASDNINPPFTNPLVIPPEFFWFAFNGNAVSCVFNNFASGTTDLALASWSSTTRSILGICGSVGGETDIFGTTGLELLVQNAQLGFGQCGETAETIAADLGNLDDPSILVTGTVAANGTVLTVQKHFVN
ncbi:hypothetical protein B0H11DRAFT_1935112 [Mycena galericulata]|nr:hypothetical protein B0H11DRAFT_1935112 [Mycena galericulata]